MYILTTKIHGTEKKILNIPYFIHLQPKVKQQMEGRIRRAARGAC